jgi:uncharacterized DUF497 family protein
MESVRFGYPRGVFSRQSMLRVHNIFEWDEEKARVNLARHRVSFLTAAEIFASEILERIDDREDYGEIRFLALGRVDTEVYRVVFTWRGENIIRIISAQKASRDEREIYHRATLP